jgi:RimJ/RimL family protein N-acetyltransferase
MRIRPLVSSDQAKLWHWLHVALWDPPPAPMRPISVLENPGVRIYAENWGHPTDVGVVAVVDDQDVGACWMRLLPAGVGLGSIDGSTPQLGIALEAEHRGKGYGKALMQAALRAAWAHGYERVSLTVHPENPAIALYEGCGFRKQGVRSTYHLMVAQREA